MRNKKFAVIAAAGTLVILSLCGTLAMNTVFAAEERISITSGNTDTALQAYADAEVLKVFKKDIYNDTGCTVVLPAGYIAHQSIKGMYVSERNPVDSSNIYYTVTEDADAELLRASLEADEHRNKTERRFKDAYGAGAVMSSYKLEKTTVDGCPAYRIKLACTVDDMTMEQLIYIVVADKTYTITYSQASDDERMEEFEQSAKTIRMVFSA